MFGLKNSPEEAEIKTVENVIFRKIKKPDGSFEFKSSDPSRKIIILKKDSEFLPDENVPYEVEIVEDSDPDNPEKGILTVKLLNEGVPIEGGAEHAERNEVSTPIEIDEETGKIFVLDTEIPYNPQKGKVAPPTEKFYPCGIHERTLATIEKIATAVELREPCLLEGETSTSKTSSIEYLAMASNNEVMRMNLNGQTDTSELIGKFVPNDGQLQIEFDQVLKQIDQLSETSRNILLAANRDGRGLTLIDSQKIAAAEGIKIPDWKWQDGIIPEAMKKGRWVILDEINLAEAQILERLNPVLEKNPALTLTENNGEKIGPGGDTPLSDKFRIFATMNPAEYSGRSPMSPAYKDRWTSYKYVENPAEKDYEAMMKLMVYGEQPKVVFRGKEYQADDQESLYPTLEAIPGFRSFIAKMAKFEVTLEALARERKIGKDRQEKYIFTRRGLIEFMAYLSEKSVVDRESRKRVSIKDNPKEIILRAIQYYFLDKISNAEDLKRVEDQLAAIGLSASNWTQKFEEVKIPKKPDANDDEVKKKLALEVGSKPEVKKFPSVHGKSIIETTGEIETGGFRIGDVLKLREGEAAIPEILSSKRLEVVGFTADDEILNPEVVIQIDGGAVFVHSPEETDHFFGKITESETKSEPKTFTGIDGSSRKTSGKTKLGTYKVGDLLKLKKDVSVREEIKKAKKLEVVGFTEEGEVLTQIDGNNVAMDSLEIHHEIFEKI